MTKKTQIALGYGLSVCSFLLLLVLIIDPGLLLFNNFHQSELSPDSLLISRTLLVGLSLAFIAGLGGKLMR